MAQLLDNDTHRDLVKNGSAHVMGLPYVIVDGNHATAISYSRVYRHQDGVFAIWRVSANLWKLAREEGAWRVTYRRNRLLDGSDEAKEILRHADETV